MPTIKASDANALIGSFVPPGVVQPFAGSTAPSGWLLCDGAPVSRPIANGGTVDTYKALYDVIGLTWGNPSGSQFNLPDLRGVFVKGAGTTSRSAGKDSAGNFYAGSLGTYLTDKMQGHRHYITAANNTIYFLVGGAGGSNFAAGGAISAAYTIGGDPTSDGPDGEPRKGLTTEPQSAGMNYIIKY